MNGISWLFVPLIVIFVLTSDIGVGKERPLLHIHAWLAVRRARGSQNKEKKER